MLCRKVAAVGSSLVALLVWAAGCQQDAPTVPESKRTDPGSTAGTSSAGSGGTPAASAGTSIDAAPAGADAVSATGHGTAAAAAGKDGGAAPAEEGISPPPDVQLPASMRVTLGLLPEGGLVNADELDEVARLASVAYVHHGSVVVLPAAGAFLLATDDIVVPVGGEELKLTRTYSSFRPDADGNAKVGVLGPGWQHSFETSGVDRKEDSSRRFDAKGRLVAMAIGGLTVGLTYEKGRLVSMGCGEAILAAFGYDDAGRLARVDGPDKVGTSFAYDGAGRLTREERAGGGKVDYEYDSAGRLVRVSGSGSPTYGFSYDQYGRASTVSGPGALSTTIAYGNRAPGIVTVTDAGGHTTRFQTEEGGRQVTVVDPAGGHTVKQFDSAGRLVHYRNPTGQVTGFSYDANGNTLSISYADGRAKRFSYDASGRLERVQLGALEARLEYGSDGHLLRFVDERGRATIYEWDGSLIRKVSSPNGRTTTYEYDDLGRVTSLTDEDGRVETRAYDAAGRLTKLTGPDGRADVVEYDPEGRVVARTDLYGGGGRWEYDAMGRVTRMVDALGGGTEFLYDESGLLTLVRKEDGLRAVALEYDSTGRLVAQSGTLGTARYEYDAAGRVTKTTDMNGGVLQRGYDAAGRVAWISRNGLQVYAAGYDGMGRLVKERGPQGPERVYTYNDAGRLVTISEGDGKTSLTYDSYGDITGIQRTGDLGGRPSVEKLRRDGDGRVVEETAIPGGTTTYVWDRRGRLAEMTTPDKRRTQWTYDEADRPAKVAVVGGETIDFTYGAGGLLKTKKSSAGWREDYDYDLLGRRTQWTDAAGVRRTYGYGSGGRLEKVTLWTSEWRYKYDLGGRLTGVIDPRGGSRAFSYVSGENPSTRIDANGRATLWSYAPNGFPAQVTLEDGAVARFTYDRAGNLQEWKVKDVVVSRRTRDSRGRVVEDVGSGHSLAWGYGPDGRLLRVKDEQANISLTYTHDGNGNLASHRLHDGTTLKYERDDLGRVLGVTGPGDASVKVSYDGLGQMKEVRLGAGLNVRYSYDLRGLVTKIEATSGGTPVLSVTRAYDAAGRITSSTQDGKTYKYRYDGDGRLAEVTRPDQSVEGYGYDRAGDLVSAGATRLTRNAGGQVTASAQPDAIYTWSKRGGLIGRNGGDAQVSLAYDAAGQLATITTGSGTQVSYGYAPDGSLLWRKDAAGETRFINDRGDVVAEIEGGTVRRVYLNGDTLDRRFGVVDGGLTRYYITDADNSVLAVVDAAGTILNRYYYDPFGQTKVDKEGVANPYRFKGRYRDAGTGLVHFRNRWYSPALRSFVQPDPVEGDLLRPETMNLYAFLENDPLNRHDPAGLKPIQWPSSIPSVIKTGADALENACKGFQSGQINGTYVSGKALDGFKCLGGIEKNGWAYDVWTKQLPNGMQNIHFRELGYKTGSGYNNMAISGNINLDTTNSKYFGQWGPSLRERLANAGEAVQKYWKDVAATVASLGGMSGTLKSSVGLIASLPGGAAIIGAAAAVAGALGYAVGTGLNSFDCVQNGAQGIISSALGYDTDQDIANTKAELENEGTVMKWKDAVNISRNLTEWGPGALTPPGGKLADGTAPLDMPPPPAGGGGVVVPPIGPFGPPLPPPRVPAEGAPPPGTNVQPPPKLTEAEAMTAVDVLTEAGIVPTRVTATGRLDVGKLISCDITVYFWNVGAYFEEEGTIYRDVKVTTICHGDAQGANQTKQGMGTFSGGPNGVFTLHSDAGGGSVQLVGGRKIVGKGNVVLTVQNPGAFDNWPESIK